MRCTNSCLWWLCLITGIGTIPCMTVFLYEWLFCPEYEEDEEEAEE